MNYSKNIKNWHNTAILNQDNYILIVKDLEDKEYFPVYFKELKDMQIYKYNIISESKLKVVDTIVVCEDVSQ